MMKLNKPFTVYEQDGKITINLDLDTWHGGVIAKYDNVERICDFLNMAALEIEQNYETETFKLIRVERKRQNEKWGEQNHPMRGFNDLGSWEHLLFPQDDYLKQALTLSRKRCETKNVGWFDILMEEVCEAFIESDPEKQREEMIQVAAVAVQIIEYLDRKMKENNNAGN